MATDVFAFGVSGHAKVVIDMLGRTAGSPAPPLAGAQ